jgi:beta-lactamase regulating signal transducer with metallopeptidase domain
MNDLGRMLIGSAVQVTLLAVVVAGVAAVFGRRRPTVAAEAIVVGLAGFVALTVASLCPLPAWWTWETALPTRQAAAASVENGPEGRETSNSSASGTPRAGMPVLDRVWPVRWLWEVDGLAEQTPQTATRPSIDVAQLAAAVCLTGFAIGVGRLLLGLWAVNRYRRAGRRIDDSRLNNLAAELQKSLGCRRSVSLRECPDLGGPATAGWLRPVLLLPAGWREWNADELRAVVAHELAHVRRGDFAARVAAGLSVALHLYHPLVHWLSSRLCLQQELAADALAAPLAGGRANYLQALARLALRLDAAAPAWPARAFLSSPRTLMRRIQMLRTKDGLNTPHSSWPAVTAVLVAGVVAVSALRSPARDADPPVPNPVLPQPDEPRMPPGAEPLPAPAKNNTPVNPPFDPVYIPDNVHGFVMCRPAALFKRPGMALYAKQVTKTFRELLARSGQGGDFPLSAEDIDWVVMTLTVKKPDEHSGGKASVFVGMRAVRTVKDFDWLKHVKALAPSVQEVHDGDRTSYRLPKSAFPELALADTSFVLPDRRTILLDSKLPPANKSHRLPPWLSGFQWRSSEKSDAVLALDCRDLGWLRDHVKSSKTLDPNLAEVLASSRSVALRFNAHDVDVDVGLFARVDNLGDFRAVQLAGDQLLANASRQATAAAEAAPDPRRKTFACILREPVNRDWSRIEDGNRETFAAWSANVKASLPELIALLLPE